MYVIKVGCKPGKSLSELWNIYNVDQSVSSTRCLVGCGPSFSVRDGEAPAKACWPLLAARSDRSPTGSASLNHKQIPAEMLVAGSL